MAAPPNEEWIFASRPSGAPDASTFRLQPCPVPTLRDGWVLVRATYFSVDPYMRGRLSEAKSYAAGWELGKPGQGGVTGVVVESRAAGLAAGDHVVGSAPWRRVFAAPGRGLRKIDVSGGLSPSMYLSVISGTGLSAYFPTLEIGKPKGGETVFVSGAAGAVGLVVGQICKLHGARVVGSAGTDEKVAHLRSVGFDDAFNYRATPPGDALDALCPKGIDMYWDNVGGETLDAALARMNTFGRIVACGGISQYNKQPHELYGIKNSMNVVRNQLKWEGFIVGRWADRFDEGRAQLASWVKSGDLRVRETVVDGFARIPTAFAGLFTGDNTGKMLVRVEAPGARL